LWYVQIDCRVGAIYYESDLPHDQHEHLADNAAFFRQILPGRDRPLGAGLVSAAPSNAARDSAA
jgi:hypothetical protein